MTAAVEHLRSRNDGHSDDPTEEFGPEMRMSGGTLFWVVYTRDALSSAFGGRATALCVLGRSIQFLCGPDLIFRQDDRGPRGPVRDPRKPDHARRLDLRQLGRSAHSRWSRHRRRLPPNHDRDSNLLQQNLGSCVIILIELSGQVDLVTP